MTRPDLDAIRKRAEAASPGPWKNLFVKGLGISSGRWEIGHPARDSNYPDFKESICDDVLHWFTRLERCPNNHVFIAHSRQDIPALLAYIDELEKKLEDK